MTPRALALLLAAYAAVLAALCAFVRAHASLRPPAAETTIASVWRGGALVARAIEPGEPDPPEPAQPGATRVREKIVGVGPIPAEPDLAFAMALVPGHDGVAATLDGRTAYVTPDDLLARQAYDRGESFPELSLSVGTRTDVVLDLLGERLHAPASEVRARATLQRIRVVRSVDAAGASDAPAATPGTLTRAEVKDAAIAAARYLARGMSMDGRMRYTVDAPTNKDVPGYDWARHGGATHFLAQAAHLSNEPELGIAAHNAASLIRDEALVTCGDHKCVGGDDTVEIGSSALALMAFYEISRTNLEHLFDPLVVELAKFLRAQQRADGEFMHLYDRAARHPVDKQFLYFSGEAALALARAHRLTHDPADLDAAKRALAYLTGPAWTFFGSRYYFGEEHWTCQLVDELWDRAPNPAALDFCVRWQAYGRKLQFGPDETAFDADGTYGVANFVTPRLTPVASRCEAGVATRHALSLSGRPDKDAQLALLGSQLRRSLARLVRGQFRPHDSRAHLFADPSAVAGAMPGSEVDWVLRIDYAQHAGSAMIRWLEANGANGE